MNFDEDQYALAYHYFTQFSKSCYGENCNDVYTNVTEYKEKSPLFVFSCLHQEEAIKTGSINMRLEFESLKDVPEHTICNILIIHDRIVHYCPLNGSVNLVA